MLRPTKGMDATPRRRRRSPALRSGQASDGGSNGMASPDPMIDFAELDAHNWGDAGALHIAQCHIPSRVGMW